MEMILTLSLKILELVENLLVRGYKEGSVGKKTYDANAGGYVTYGGEKCYTLELETFFPVPFLKKSDQYRLSALLMGRSF